MARALGPTIEIAASDRQLRDLERAIAKAPKKAHKGAVRALKKSLRSGKTGASKQIRQHINLKKRVVDQRIRTKVISERQLIGSLAVRDRRIELVEFMTPSQIAAAYRRGQAGRSKGVAVKAYKQKGRQVYPGTFVNIGHKDGQWHVLKRTGRERYPVYIQYGPNLIEQYQKALPAFAERMSAVLQQNMDHEIAFALGLK